MMTSKISVPVLASAAAIAVVTAWLLFKKRKVYTKVAKVKKLFFYPVKSMKAVEVKKLEFGNIGVEVDGVLDRTFMVMSGDNTLVSQRQEPALVLLTPSISGNEVIISGGSQPPLKVHIKKSISLDDKIVVCRVHTEFVKVIDCGEDAAKWLSIYLKRSDVRLVQGLPAVGTRDRGHKICLQDRGQVHVAATSSIEELNKKLEKNVSELNFRPNILVEGSLPFQEDHWQYIRFSNSAELATAFPCGRCVMTTVDTSLGIKENIEPLKSLRTFRAPKDGILPEEMKHSPCFGTLCRIEKQGVVCIGDEVSAVVNPGSNPFVKKSEN